MSRDKIFSQVDFLEESFLDKSEAAPTTKTLRRWRREAPERAGFTLVVGRGMFDPPATRSTAVDELVTAAEALEAEVVIFRPPARLAPSQSNRDYFRQLCLAEATEEALGGATRALWPRGLWDLQLALELSRELDLVLCFDPLANDPLEELPEVLASSIERGAAYLRPDRIGTPRRRFDPFELETLAEMVAELERVWVSFAHGERVRDALELKKLIST